MRCEVEHVNIVVERVKRIENGSSKAAGLVVRHCGESHHQDDQLRVFRDGENPSLLLRGELPVSHRNREELSDHQSAHRVTTHFDILAIS